MKYFDLKRKILMKKIVFILRKYFILQLKYAKTRIEDTICYELYLRLLLTLKILKNIHFHLLNKIIFRFYAN